MNWSRNAPRAACVSRLLVVDDTAMVREMLAELFHRHGFEIETAGSAAEALTLGRMIRWDGLILDVDLPGMNGVELYAEMVRLNQGVRLPVIFFTGRANEPLETGLGNVPWARLIMKPCPGVQLVESMRRCLQAASGRPNAAGTG